VSGDNAGQLEQHNNRNKGDCKKEEERLVNSLVISLFDDLLAG
jgi:hypothetical protein